jgi:xylulokinase
MYLLGFDIGSSSLKAALVNVDTNQTVAIESFPDTEMDILARRAGWAEQSPEVWWQNLCTLTKRILAKAQVKSDDIHAIGIGYQMHGLIVVDENNQVLRPAIIWCDCRAIEIGKEAYSVLGEEVCRSTLYNSPGNFTASKLKWIKDNEPDVYRRIHKIMLPGDYIAMRLMGQVTTTLCGLSEGIFWDFKANKVSDAVLKYFGFDASLLPQVVPVFGNQGKLTAESASLIGLKTGTPITYRSGDQLNNALSLNVLRPGEVAATSGTSGVVYGIIDKPIFDAKGRINAFAHVNHHADRPRIGTLLCINGAGIGYSWFKHQIAREGTTYQDMERMASSVSVGSDGLCLLPFGNGAERMTEDQILHAHLTNLQYTRHTRAHLFRATLEGVAFSFVHGIQILKELGLDVQTMRVGNDNMFQSRVFSMTISTLLDIEIEMYDTTGAVGAARAAGVGIGCYKNIEHALEGIKSKETFTPDLDDGLCKQAYSYWSNTFDHVIKQKRGIAQTRVKSNDRNIPEADDVAIKLAAKLDLLKHVQHSLEQMIKAQPNSANAPNLQQLLKRISQSEEQENPWGLLEDRLQMLQNGYWDKLVSICPTITVNEVKMCTLLRLKYSTKEMAQYFNLSVRGVETKRYRLRRKLNLGSEADMADFLNRL